MLFCDQSWFWTSLAWKLDAQKLRHCIIYLCIYFHCIWKLDLYTKRRGKCPPFPGSLPKWPWRFELRCPNQDPGASAGLPRARRAQGPESSCSAFSVGLARSATTTPRQHCILKTGSEAGRVPQLPFSLWPWISFQTCAICEMEVIIMVTLQIFGRS